MKITFKDVGQGDSIIIEWTNESPKIGIIDCCVYKANNPIVNFLKINNYSEIEFLFISHPHIDHYSGILELLEYCEKNKIIIKLFAHTMTPHPDYLNWVEIDETDLILLRKIIFKTNDLRTRNIIKKINHIVENWYFYFNDSLFLKAISPSDIETKHYTSKIDYFKNENRQLCSLAANYLSSLFVISSTKSEHYSLLTSDSQQITFKRLKVESFSEVKKKIILFQIPHHGSKKSLLIEFWDSIIYEEKCNAAISAGLHLRYNHPDYEVVKYFANKNIITECTNYINGFKLFFDQYSKEMVKYSVALDDISELIIHEEVPSSDLVYNTPSFIY